MREAPDSLSTRPAPRASTELELNSKNSVSCIAEWARLVVGLLEYFFTCTRLAYYTLLYIHIHEYTDKL